VQLPDLPECVDLFRQAIDVIGVEAGSVPIDRTGGSARAPISGNLRSLSHQ
jgi:hypothetical protein